MRITEIEGFDILPPFQDFNTVAINRYHGVGLQRRGILVVKTDNGLEGYGENWGSLPDVDALRAEYVGTDPFDWMGALVDLPMCMANYDLMGKYLGVPAWRLIGPKVRSWVPVSAWTVSQKPDDMAEEVRQAAQRAMQAGAQGIKIIVKGRISGSEIARVEKLMMGQVPLHTLRADIDYSLAEAHTVMGRVGVKVWVYNGEILPPQPEEVEELETIEVTVQADEVDQALELAELEEN